MVCNTTPISELAKAGRLQLLHDIYGSIVIPTEVRDELAAGSHPAVTAVQSFAWIRVRSLRSRRQAPLMHNETRLGLGECAAILLAAKIHADLLILDDLAARREAASRGLPLIGTVGTVLLAKQQGHITSVKEILDELISQGCVSVGSCTRTLWRSRESDRPGRSRVATAGVRSDNRTPLNLRGRGASWLTGIVTPAQEWKRTSLWAEQRAKRQKLAAQRVQKQASAGTARIRFAPRQSHIPHRD